MAELTATDDAAAPEAAPEADPGELLVPSKATAVKFEKPLATMTSATLRPSALKAVVLLVAELAFSVSLPTTAGSMSGTIPLSTAVVGSVGSLQIEGMLTTNGLKFCSAATRPFAAAIESAPVPSSATI